MQYGRFSGGFRYFPVRNRRLSAAAKMKVLMHVALNSLSFDFDWSELRLAFLRRLDPEDLDGDGIAASLMFDCCPAGVRYCKGQQRVIGTRSIG